MDVIRLNEIRKYIRTYHEADYIGSELQYVEDYVADEDKEEILEALDDFFWSDYLEFCGCGNPEYVKVEIKKYLIYLSIANKDFAIEYLKKNFGVCRVYENPTLLFMAYTLNSHDIANHGGSVNNSWLTELGKMWLEVLNELY